jgi:hypothetical protein
MLLNVICFGLLFSGALSDAIPENATYVLAENLAFPEGFSQSPGLLQPADELQKRQGFRCPLPGWSMSLPGPKNICQKYLARVKLTFRSSMSKHPYDV